MSHKEKNSSIELLRLVATIGVIFCHVGTCWLTYYGSSGTVIDRITYRSLNLIFHWPVPVFMLVTGALLLGKPQVLGYRDMWKYIKRIGLLTLSFGWLYAMMELYFDTHRFSTSLIVHGLLNILQGDSWKHLWYMYMLLGIYLALPIISLCKKFLPPPLQRLHLSALRLCLHAYYLRLA